VYVAGTSSGNSAPPATFGRRKCKYLVEVPYVYYLCSPVPGQLLRSARSIRMSGSDARWLVIERRRVVSELRVLRSGKWLGCGSRLTRAKRDELVIEQLKRNILRSCNCNPGETPKGYDTWRHSDEIPISQPVPDLTDRSVSDQCLRLSRALRDDVVLVWLSDAGYFGPVEKGKGNGSRRTAAAPACSPLTPF
jgi:hypothetical protein